MTDLPSGPSAPLPAPILQALRAFIRRARRVIVVRGACATAAVTAASFLLVMLIDAGFTLYAAWPRWLLTVAAYAASAATAVWFVIRPLARSFTLAGAARLIEAHHPELQERISSAVELLTSHDVPALRGSDVLIAALTEEAVRDAGGVQPRHEISFRAARPFVAGALLGVGILAALFIARPLQTRFLLARATAPFLNLPNIYATELTVTPGDVYVAQGCRLTISVTASNSALRQITLLRSTLHEGEEATDMVAIPTTNAARATFAFTVPTVAHSFQYRIHAGDALTRYYRVNVSVPPTLQRLGVHYRFPPYTRLADVDDKDALGAIRALVGTEVTFSAQVNKPCSNVFLAITAAGAPAPIPGVLRAEGATLFYDFRLTMPPRLAGIWTVALKDTLGLTNAPFERTIQAIPDRPPVIRAPELMRAELRLNRDERLPVAYVAEDDLGLRDVLLRLSVDGKDLPDRLLPLPATNAPIRLVRDRTVIDLSDREFLAAHQVRFSLLARDGLPGPQNGPQCATTEVYTILLDAQVASWAAQSLDSQKKALKQGLEQTRDMLKSTAEAQKAVADNLKKTAPLPGETVKTLDRMQERLASAQTTLRETGEQLRNGFFQKLAERAEAVADEQVGKAENLASQIKLADTPTERTQLAAATGKQVETAVASVEQMIKELDPLDDALKQAVELDRMANRQNDLAKDRAAMDKVPASALTNAASELPTPGEWKASEERLADNLAKLAREMPQATNAFAQWRNQTAAEAAHEAAALSISQSNLADAVKQQMTALQSIDKTLAGLAERQDKLAQAAKTNPQTAPEADRMAKAAEQIKADALPDARASQTAAEQALQQTAAALRQEVPPPESVKPETAPKEAAAQAAQRARAALDEAKRSSQDADKSAAEAGKRAADAAKREQQAAKNDKPALAEAKQNAAAARRDATEAAAWDQAAKQSVNQAREAAQQAQQAATQAEHAPNPAEAENARFRAEEAAERAEQAAAQAKAFAQEAAHKNAEPGAPQDRAAKTAEAPGKAQTPGQPAAAEAKPTDAKQDAAQEARHSADQARDAAERAERAAQMAQADADQAARSADQAKHDVEQAKGKDEVARQQAEAKQSDQLAKAARQAASEARQSAAAAQRAAQEAGQDAQKTQSAGTEQQAQAARIEAAQAAQAARDDAANADKAARAAHNDARLASAKQNAETAEQLARDQAQVRAATEALLTQREQAVESLRREQMAFLQTEQGRLAAQADALAKDVAAVLPERKAEAEAAAGRADKARDALTEGNLPQAAQAAGTAGQDLGKLSGELHDTATQLNDRPVQPPTATATPGQVAKMAEQAAELAADQTRLGNELSALAAGRPIEALASQQDFLAAQVAGLDGDVQRLSEQSAELPLPGSSAAALGQAAEQTRRAQGAAAEATADMKQAAAAPAQSEAAARQAAQAQGQSAQQLGQAAQALHQAEAATAGATASAGQMALPESLDELGQAAQSQSSMAAIQAAEALAQAAGRAKQQARAMGGNPSPSAPRMGQTGTGINPLEPLADEQATMLQRLGLRLRDWLRLPGALRDDVMQGAQSEGPEEYRPLIKRYFQEVAKQGGQE